MQNARKYYESESQPDPAQQEKMILDQMSEVRFIARRIVIAASEDVGMADPTALQTAVAALALALVALAALDAVRARILARVGTYLESSLGPDAVERGIYPKEYLVGPDDLVRILPSPDMIHIMVCGDPNRNRVMVLWGGYVNPVTKKMEFPSL